MTDKIDREQIERAQRQLDDLCERKVSAAFELRKRFYEVLTDEGMRTVLQQVKKLKNENNYA